MLSMLVKTNKHVSPSLQKPCPSLRTSYWEMNQYKYEKHLAPGTHGKDDNPPGMVTG